MAALLAFAACLRLGASSGGLVRWPGTGPLARIPGWWYDLAVPSVLPVAAAPVARPSVQGGNVTGEEAIAVMQIRGFEGADHPLTLPKLAHSSAQPLLVGFGFKRFPEASTTGSRSGWLGQPAGDP